MLSNCLLDVDLNLPEMKTKSPSCPSEGYHMYAMKSMLDTNMIQLIVDTSKYDFISQELQTDIELLARRLCYNLHVERYKKTGICTKKKYM